MKISKKVKIGALTWKVLLKKNDPGTTRCGSTDVKKIIIEIDSDMDKRAQEITFVHELIHAINTEVMDEITTEYFSLSLYQIIQENPGIFNK